MDIHDFLALPHRFRWGGVGGDDCMTFAASWVQFATGIDPAEDLRGTYRTQNEAHAVIAAHGGALSFMGGRLTGIGATRVYGFADGDIGLVRAPVEDGEFREIGAVRFGPLWAVITPARVVAKKLDHIAVWRLPK